MIRFRNSWIIGIMGFMAIVMTLGLFFSWTTSRVLTQWLGLSFFILAQLVFFGGNILLILWKSDSDKLFTYTFSSIISFFYLVSTFILFLVSRLFITHVTVFLSLELTLLAIVILMSLLYWIFANKNALDDQEAKRTRESMQWCIQKIYQLSQHPASKEYQKEFNHLYESMKYAQKSSVSLFDQRIIAKLETLEAYLQKDGDAKDLDELLHQITILIQERELVVTESNRGGF